MVLNSTPLSGFVNSQPVNLLQAGIFNYVVFIWNICFRICLHWSWKASLRSSHLSFLPIFFLISNLTKNLGTAEGRLTSFSVRKFLSTIETVLRSYFRRRLLLENNNNNYQANKVRGLKNHWESSSLERAQNNLTIATTLNTYYIRHIFSWSIFQRSLRATNNMDWRSNLLPCIDPPTNQNQAIRNGGATQTGQSPSLAGYWLAIINSTRDEYDILILGQNCFGYCAHRTPFRNCFFVPLELIPQMFEGNIFCVC